MNDEHSAQSLREQKRTLRRAILQRRREIYQGARTAASARSITARLTALLAPVLAANEHKSLVIASFSPVAAEASPLSFTRSLARMGHTILLPTFAGEELQWCEWDGIETLQESPAPKFGSEPTGTSWGHDALAKADIVIIPAVALDRSGTRLGHGKGYYDKALRYARENTLVVAVVHDDEILEAGSIPAEPHDQRIGWVVSESHTLQLGS